MQVVAVPSFVADLEAVATMDLGQHITPMITMLDKVALRKAISKADAKLADVHDGNGKRASLVGEAFNPVVTEARFIEQAG